MSRQSAGHYEAMIEGIWRTVPNSVVLNRTDNPTGRAIARWMPQSSTILCFVPPPQS